MSKVPVITIDGPSGSGKGTLCQLLAKRLGWHLLDSGALYRVVGLAAVKHGYSFDDRPGLAKIAKNLDVSFNPAEVGQPAAVILEGDDISDQVRAETSGDLASKVAVVQEVRDALLQRQRDFRQLPGLVADGRDMGTVVFPDAPLKIYLTASAQERAQRRYKQLKDKDESVSLAALLEDIQVRDKRDMERAVAPLRPADDAIQLDSTKMDIDEVLHHVLQLARQCSLLPD